MGTKKYIKNFIDGIGDSRHNSYNVRDGCLFKHETFIAQRLNNYGVDIVVNSYLGEFYEGHKFKKVNKIFEECTDKVILFLPHGNIKMINKYFETIWNRIIGSKNEEKIKKNLKTIEIMRTVMEKIKEEKDEIKKLIIKRAEERRLEERENHISGRRNIHHTFNEWLLSRSVDIEYDDSVYLDNIMGDADE